jgi:hypothetical protein
LAGQVYLALYRVSWSIGLFILSLVCLAGWGGWITSILSMQSFAPYSRLVYGAYLVHPILCQAFAFGAQHELLYSAWNYLNWCVKHTHTHTHRHTQPLDILAVGEA